jgi:spheroidene monooxygenase
LDPGNNFVFVLTRARIKLKFLKKFWDYVPISQRGLNSNPNLLYKLGVGEWPVTHMATLSLWDDMKALRNYAYRGKEHKAAIQQTQALDWYAEEMFSRFQPYKVNGNFRQFEVPYDLRREY